MTSTIDTMMDRAGDCFRQGDYASAEALYSAVLQQQPNNVKALSNRSGTFLKLDQPQRALNDARTCTVLNPNFVKGWGRLGAALHALKHYPDAIAAYQRAAALEPANASYPQSIAELNALVQQGGGIASDDGRAEYYFKKSVEQGVQAMKDGHYDVAVRHFTKAMSQTPACTPEMHVLLANRSAAYLKLNKTLEALDDATEAVKLKPHYARAHVRLAAAASARDDLTLAQRAIKDALNLEPQNSAALEVAEKVRQQVAAFEAAAELRRAKEAADREELAKAAAASGRQDTQAPTSRAPPTAASAGTFVPSAGARHTVSYLHCRICSEFGHAARDCPLRRRM